MATRRLPRAEAKLLPPGSDHYMAYVGPPSQWDFMGATQFRLLTALGLREGHRVLDVGCGSLRAGRLLIPYLEKGGYFGIEPNMWLVEEAIERELGRQLVDAKAPQFSNSDTFAADAFGVTFDFIVAQSIFSHAGPDLVALALARFSQALAPDGLILATFIHDTDAPDFPVERPGWLYPQCLTFSKERISELIAGAGLLGVELPWYHPRQTWYAIGCTGDALPRPDQLHHLTGAVLRSPEFAASCGISVSKG